MTDTDFARLSDYIQLELGIKMPASKKTMLESRLQKRLRALGLGSFSEYCDYIFSPQGMENELIHMMDLVTTNKTDFFREADHFDYLFQHAVPDLIRGYGAGVRRDLILWSAGCSTGEEPYTLAMVMQEFSEQLQGLGFEYTIIATDISTRVLDAAGKGIYKEERIEPVPMELRKKYLLKSKDRSAGLVRMGDEIRSRIKYRRLNLMSDDFGFREPVDIIFCRNVMIYFDRQIQERLFNKFHGCLRQGGYLFIGHSESLNGLNAGLQKVAPSVYRKM